MTPTDLETLRGFIEAWKTFQRWKQLDADDSPDADDDEYMEAQLELAAYTDLAISALTALLADYERMRDKVPNASSVCPICGIATPHHHDAAEQAQYREKCKSDSLNQIRAVLPDDWKLVPASLIDWVMKLQHQKGCHPGIINTYDPLIYNDCTCGLDALRATLKGEKHE